MALTLTLTLTPSLTLALALTLALTLTLTLTLALTLTCEGRKRDSAMPTAKPPLTSAKSVPDAPASLAGSRR